jgi:prophage tail gpP-like protein
MPDLVTIEIDGVEFSGWEALTITRSLTSVARSFSFSSPFDPDRPALVSALRPFGYQSAVVKIDGELIVTGRIEKVSPAISAGDRAINVQGRSLTGIIADCAHAVGRYQYDGLALSTIAKQVCSPFGVSVSAFNATNPIKEARCEPGQKAFEFLNRLAQDVGLLLTDNEKGELVIRRVTGTGAPVAAIVEGARGVLSVSADYDGTKRYSTLKVLQQQDGSASLSGVANDTGVSIYRPNIETGSESDAKNLTDAAAWRRALSLAGCITIGVEIAGWRHPGGGLWDAGQIVTLRSPGAFILNETPMLISDVSLTLDAQAGRKTGLALVLPGTYSGTMPEVEPWA